MQELSAVLMLTSQLRKYAARVIHKPCIKHLPPKLHILPHFVFQQQAGGFLRILMNFFINLFQQHVDLCQKDALPAGHIGKFQLRRQLPDMLVTDDIIRCIGNHALKFPFFRLHERLAEHNAHGFPQYLNG